MRIVSFDLSTQGRDYNFDVVTEGQGRLSSYTIIPAKQDELPVIQELFKQAKIDESLTMDELTERLSALPEVTHVEATVNRLFHQLVHMVRSCSSDADLEELARESLSQNNNDPKLALAGLKAAFSLAGRGAVSERVADILKQQASLKNTEEITAFGRRGIFGVVNFIKSLPQTAKGAIDLTKLKRIGGGGTQDVYVLKNQPRRFVLKVNRESTALEADARKDKYTRDNEAYRKLHDSFGDHCTVEQLLLRKVADSSGIKEAIISIADFEAGFNKESKIGLQADDFEWNILAIAQNLESYEEMLKSLFFAGGDSSFDKESLNHIENGKITDLIAQDSAFRDSMKEFLSRFKEYFEETGQYLDIAGQDNIICFRDDGKWTFKLGTVIKRETRDKFGKLLDWVEEGTPECEDQRLRMAMLNYCIHWTKTLNTLGMMVGMGRIIDDANVKHVASIWERLRDTMRIPADPERVSKIIEAVQNPHSDDLEQRFKVLGVKPQEEIDLLLDIFSRLTSSQRLALAKYLKDQLPRASDSEPPDCRFCYCRYHMACSLKEFDEGRKLALEFFKDVLKDPDAPREEVEAEIHKLENST